MVIVNVCHLNHRFCRLSFFLNGHYASGGLLTSLGSNGRFTGLQRCNYTILNGGYGVVRAAPYDSLVSCIVRSYGSHEGEAFTFGYFGCCLVKGDTGYGDYFGLYCHYTSGGLLTGLGGNGRFTGLQGGNHTILNGSYGFVRAAPYDGLVSCIVRSYGSYEGEAFTFGQFGCCLVKGDTSYGYTSCRTCNLCGYIGQSGHVTFYVREIDGLHRYLVVSGKVSSRSH